MIIINVWRNLHGEIDEFLIEGHADFAKKGKDIICAGVSSLTQTAVLGLICYLSRKDSYSITNGNMSVKLIEPPDLQTQAILETMLLGITEIAKKYYKLVKVQEHRR